MNQLKTLINLLVIGLITIGCQQTPNKKLPLQITGIIKNVKTITIVSTANSGKITQELRVFIDLDNATDYNGQKVNPNNYDYPYFVSKDLNLRNTLKKGNLVKIVGSSTSSKHIETIEIIN